MKYRADEAMWSANGPDFDRAMMHTTLVGLQPDEAADTPEEEHDPLGER